MILCRFCSLCVLESWERRVWWTGVWWGETLGGQHTGGGSDLSGRGSCPPQEVSTGQGGRWGDVVGGLLSTEEGVNRLRSCRALTPREVWRGAAKGGVVRPRSWTALAPWEVWRQGRCRQAEIVDSPSTMGGAEGWHRGRYRQAEIVDCPSTAGGLEVSPIPRDCRLLGK